MGIWLLAIAVNFIPVFVYFVVIVSARTVKEEGQPEIAHTKRYGVQRSIILVPFLVDFVTIVPELQCSKG